MKTQLAITIFSLFVLATPTCFNPIQADRHCSKCADIHVLIQGSCYPKMRGCLEYSLPGPKCKYCQNGYVLVQTKCVRKALVSHDPDHMFVPGAIVDKLSTLNLNQFHSDETPSFAPQFADIFEELIQNDSQLIDGRVNSTKFLKIKNGVFLIMVCQTDLKKYEAVYFMNQKKQKTIVYVKSSGCYSMDPFTINALIQRNLGINLVGYELEDVVLRGTAYTFIYAHPLTSLAYQVYLDMSQVDSTFGNYLMVKTAWVCRQSIQQNP